MPADTENVALRSVAALARFVAADAEEPRDAALEELRDLSVEIEGDDAEATAWEKGVVRVLAGTAFARAGEIEEALEILGAGNDTQNLEAYVSSPHSIDHSPCSGTTSGSCNCGPLRARAYITPRFFSFSC